MAKGEEPFASAIRGLEMSDWLKVFGEMSIDSLFVVAGLGFLAIGVIGKISGKVDPTPPARATLAGLGVFLVISGVWIHREHLAVAPSQHEANGPTRASEVHAQEVAPDRHVAAVPTNTQRRPVRLSYFAGRWKNADDHTHGLTKLNIRTAGESVWVRAWGACHPSDCEWGEVAGIPLSRNVSSNPASEADKVTAVFETSFSNTVLTLSPADDDELQADTQTRFTDNSGRSGYSSTYTFRH